MVTQLKMSSLAHIYQVLRKECSSQNTVIVARNLDIQKKKCCVHDEENAISHLKAAFATTLSGEELSLYLDSRLAEQYRVS